MAEENFAFLDDESIRVQQEIVKSSQKSSRQTQSLSSVLAGVNDSLKTANSKKRDSEVFFTREANTLAAESDKITNQVLQAKADPFHAIKVLFTDIKSIDDLAADHNNIQNQLHATQRRFASGQAEFNAEISEIQQELTFAKAQKQLTSQGISQLQSTATAISTSISTRLNTQNQELDNLLLPDLQRELADPASRLKKGLVQKRIFELEGLAADKRAVANTRNKSALQLQKEKAEFLEKHASLIPETLVNQAIEQQTPVFWQQGGITITAQDATQILPRQQEAQQERAKLISSLTTSKLQAQQGIMDSASAMKRFAGPGVDVLTRDSSGNPTGINADAFTPEIKSQFLDIQQDNFLIGEMELMIERADGTKQTELIFAQQELQSRVKAKSEAFVNKIAEEKATEFDDDNAKIAIKSWVTTGKMRTPSGATAVLTESFAVSLPTVQTSSIHGIGWGAGATVLAQQFQTQVRDDAGDNPEFLGEDSELSQQQLMISLMSTTKGKTTAEASMAKSFGAVDENGNNKIQSEILQDWYQVGLIKGIESIAAQHENEPETQKLLSQFSANGVTLSGATVTSSDAFQYIFAKLRMDELALIQSEVLPKESNITQDLMREMLKGEFYARPEIKKLTATNESAVSAAISKHAFANQPTAFFQQGMKSNLASIPLDNIDEAIAFIDAQTEKARVQQEGAAGSGIELEKLFKIKAPTSASLINMITEIKKSQL